MVYRWKLAQWFEVRWWRHYLKRKPTAPYLKWKKEYWREFLEKADIQISPHEKILDAGCGPSGIFLILTNNEVKAVDPLLNRYLDDFNLLNEGQFPHVKFETVTLESFEERDVYDSIFCLNVINHVADIDMSLSNLFKALKKDGKIYLSVDAHRYPFLRKLFRLIPGDILHPHQLNLQEYMSKLKGAGFSINTIKCLKENRIFNYQLIEATK